MNDLWRGTLATRLRISSGLVLFTYALLHFVNIGLGMLSPVWMDAMQDARQLVTRSFLGSVLLYGAFTVHITFALVKLARRGTLRMPVWEAVQIGLGITIPILLVAHLVHTRTAHEIHNVNDEMGYIMLLLYNTADGWKQSLLLLVVWLHGCTGLHFWLRGQAWWRRYLPALTGAAVLVPAFALAGFLVEGRRVKAQFSDPDAREAMIDRFNFPDRETFAELITLTDQMGWLFGAIMALVALAYLVKYIRARQQSVTIRYHSGAQINAPRGLTLLEMSRLRGIPHAALCGGRGRCTTCRVVIEEGLELLHPPSEAEARSLAAVGAEPNTRLACQIKPMDPMTVMRVFQPDGRSKNRGHASQGEEKELALLFLDMRGFTARTTGQLPYDVVFLLNRFFDAIVPSINAQGGTVDKYLGDGFLAVFELPASENSAHAALRAIEGIAQALANFNATLAREGQSPVAIGIGAHLGDVVLGEIGAAGQAPRTLIGDTVNTASRIEGVTKEFKVQAFVSAPLLAAAGHAVPQDQMEALDLRGLSSPLLAWPVQEASDLSVQLARFRSNEETQVPKS
ncbi:adenylate/guanylate cyclase domain-containing protein [Sulfitobacter geojensis]|uniref:Adenylate/guanylate cyclase domain-containing protein n=1 Tax=Sulfitobacter geojensis TaxID=1342299 RepID=A0AAE2VZI8_9RHOB|nr:adenylate/guanylate cyclase domain-containing protein [Sulfitobacter geojensis]MBM1690187.1 adenylate/guanylate cyclase domain-containing protein [Sulfitobacter geojensis]MBM1694253.1 adenylate/guanylate cyclase domain-containing protein [Sulfitobacter geojensis]MBM1706419.1 adenylate/guanylate cyclase domain-containing protein [Sulfitobacter geojensis]MBM1710477.1 adenylate/guanylate cyclase domain-containing protein [Sulfitobacter geojensis]MBM1714543.1 adenylate/guanylate cyclase domain-